MKEIILKSATAIGVRLQKLQEEGNAFFKDYSAEQIDQAVQNYKRFLILYANYKHQNLVATVEISLIWKIHSEMQNYEQYCIKQFREVMTRNVVSELRKKEKEILEQDFLTTKVLHETEFGIPYEGEMSLCSTLEQEYIVESVQTFF